MDRESRKRRAIQRRMAEAGGLRVECMRCSRPARYPNGHPKRLRELRCKGCHGPLRPTWWIARNPERAKLERLQAQKGEAVRL